MAENAKEFVKKIMRYPEKESGTGAEKANEDSVRMIFDETGDAGKEGSDGDPLFAMTAAITDKPMEMEEIAIKFRKLLKHPVLKARDISPESRTEIVKEVSKLEPEVHSVYIDRRCDDNPEWWNNIRNRKEVYKRVFSETANEAMSKTDRDNFDVLVDRHKHLQDGEGERIVRQAAEDNNKTIASYSMESSQHGTHRNQIQANDAVTYSVREKIVRGEPANADMLKMNLKRLTKQNVRK